MNKYTEYCDDIELKNLQTYGESENNAWLPFVFIYLLEKSDWKLPTKTEELQTIYNNAKSASTELKNKHGKKSIDSKEMVDFFSLSIHVPTKTNLNKKNVDTQDNPSPSKLSNESLFSFMTKMRHSVSENGYLIVQQGEYVCLLIPKRYTNKMYVIDSVSDYIGTFSQHNIIKYLQSNPKTQTIVWIYGHCGKSKMSDEVKERFFI